MKKETKQKDRLSFRVSPDERERLKGLAKVKTSTISKILQKAMREILSAESI